MPARSAESAPLATRDVLAAACERVSSACCGGV